MSCEARCWSAQDPSQAEAESMIKPLGCHFQLIPLQCSDLPSYPLCENASACYISPGQGIRLAHRPASFHSAPEGHSMQLHRHLALLLFLLACLFYCAIIVFSMSDAYIDLGDGNYLYTSSRMADGLLIYRDFLSPQPPMHLLTGSALISLGHALGNPVITVRVFSMLLHVATATLLFLLGWRVARNPYGGALASIIYFMLPIGFWWSLGYQSELLEIFFLLCALLLFLPLRKWGVAGAGIFMALAVLTNMTAAPYALAIAVYVAVRHPRQLLPFYIGPLFIILAVIIGYFEVRTGAYFENVVANQVGSYPRDNLLGYAGGKLTSQGLKILYREGGFILLSLLGLILYSRRDSRPEREFLVWYALVLLLSFVFVTKGGTADYIFTIGEPMVALFAAYFLTWYFSNWRKERANGASFWHDTRVVPQGLFGFLLLVSLWGPGLLFIVESLQQKTFEQNQEGLRKVQYFIKKYSKPRDSILSPPYYAFITNRLLVEEYSELFLWTLKYSLEKMDGVEGEGTRKVQAIASELQARRVPIVIANVSPANPDILRSEEIRSAVDRYYKPLLSPEQRFKTLSTDTQVFIPKTDEEIAAAP